MRDNDGRQAVLAFLGGVAIMVVALGAFLVFVGDEGSPPLGAQGLRREDQARTCYESSFTPCLAPSRRLLDAYPDASTCDQSGSRVCLVPVGDAPVDLIAYLVEQYRAKYGLEVHVLRPVEVFPDLGKDRRQMDIFEVARYVCSDRAYRRVCWDQQAVLIAVAPFDVFSYWNEDWAFAFGDRLNMAKDARAEEKFGVVSSYRLDPQSYGQKPNPELRNLRVEKMVSKYIAIMHYGMEPSSDPKSITYSNILSVRDIDRMSATIPLPE